MCFVYLFSFILFDCTQAPTQLVTHTFCYWIHIHVDTHGVALPVSEQSSCFRDDAPGYTASLGPLLTKMYLLCTKGGRILPLVESITFFFFSAPESERKLLSTLISQVNRLPKQCCHACLRGATFGAIQHSVYDACWQRFTHSVPGWQSSASR